MRIINFRKGRGYSYCNSDPQFQFLCSQKLLLMISDPAGREEYKKPEPISALPLPGGKKLH